MKSFYQNKLAIAVLLICTTFGLCAYVTPMHAQNAQQLVRSMEQSIERLSGFVEGVTQWTEASQKQAPALLRQQLIPQAKVLTRDFNLLKNQSKRMLSQSQYLDPGSRSTLEFIQTWAINGSENFTQWQSTLQKALTAYRTRDKALFQEATGFEFRVCESGTKGLVLGLQELHQAIGAAKIQTPAPPSPAPSEGLGNTEEEIYANLMKSINQTQEEAYQQHSQEFDKILQQQKEDEQRIYQELMAETNRVYEETYAHYQEYFRKIYEDEQQANYEKYKDIFTRTTQETYNQTYKQYSQQLNKLVQQTVAQQNTSYSSYGPSYGSQSGANSLVEHVAASSASETLRHNISMHFLRSNDYKVTYTNHGGSSWGGWASGQF